MSGADSQFEQQRAVVRRLASDLGLQPDFFEQLWLEDDCMLAVGKAIIQLERQVELDQGIEQQINAIFGGA